jgi:ring-1,2-phenylacetyl-CoA epoxidase subunit PaaE
MSKFRPLIVKKIIRETADAVTLQFDRPTEPEWNYKAGQYLTLRVKVEGKDERRAYSLCTSPLTDSHLAVTVKQVANGKVSTYIGTQLTEGTTLEVYQPSGNFTHVPDAAKAQHYILLAGGSGITPILSIIKTVLAAEAGSQVTLLYGNRNEASIIFRTTLEALAAQYPDKLRVVHVLETPPADWTGMTGRLDRNVLIALGQELLGRDNLPKQVFMCGPAPMMDEAALAFGFLGLPKERIHRELFTAPLPDPDAIAAKAAAEKKRGNYEVKVLLDGKEYMVKVPSDKTILHAAIDAGVDPPFACTMGVCCTCRAKVLSGSVDMEEDEGLSDSEIEQGYVLTCQSHPMTPDVVVEYM